MIKPKVLFLCGANSCRTQMAEGFLRDLAGDRFEAMSAGYEPSEEVCPDAIEAMREVGIDISDQRPKKTDDFLGQRIGYVVTLCNRREGAWLPHFSRRALVLRLASAGPAGEYITQGAASCGASGTR